MAELLQCNLCGFITVRVGMHNHLKAKHQEEFKAADFNVDKVTKSIGEMKYRDFAVMKIRDPSLFKSDADRKRVMKKFNQIR